MIYQYFIDGFWQTCKIIDFHNLVYIIEFKGNLIGVIPDKIRFIKDNEQLFTPIQQKNINSEVVFQ
jgi:hypothetical protein